MLHQMCGQQPGSGIRSQGPRPPLLKGQRVAEEGAGGPADQRAGWEVVRQGVDATQGGVPAWRLPVRGRHRCGRGAQRAAILLLLLQRRRRRRLVYSLWHRGRLQAALQRFLWEGRLLLWCLWHGRGSSSSRRTAAAQALRCAVVDRARRRAQHPCMLLLLLLLLLLWFD